MNYITDQFDFSLLQFGPLNVLVAEVDFRTAFAEIHKSPYYWFLSADSSLKKTLAESEYFARYMDLFDKFPDVPNSELVGYNSDDKIVVVVPTGDSHLTVAQTGVRFFIITFEERKIRGRFFIGDVEVTTPKVTE